MGGIVGRLLHEFAVTIGVAILISGFVSISLTPMLCSRFLKPPHTQRHGRLYNAIESVFQTLAARSTTGRCASSLRYRAVTMAVSIALLAGTVYLFTHRAERLPAQRGSGPLPWSIPKRSQGISFDDMVRHQMQVADDHREGPERRQRQCQRRARSATRRRVELRTDLGRVDSRAASGRCRSTRSSRTLRPKVAQIPGIRVFMINQPPINLGGRGWVQSQRCISSRCRTPTPTSCISGRRSSKTRCGRSRASRTSAATCCSGTRRSPSTWTATRCRHWV